MNANDMKLGDWVVTTDNTAAIYHRFAAGTLLEVVEKASNGEHGWRFRGRTEDGREGLIRPRDVQPVESSVSE